jgi:hypothetical protein
MLVLALFAAPPSSAQEFSADIVQTPAKGTAAEKLYVGKTKVRFQTLEGGQPTTGVIFDLAQNTLTIVNDKDHTYLGGSDSPLTTALMNAMGGPMLLRFFHPARSNDPCATWNEITLPYARLDSTRTPPHFTCQSLGGDAVNGRSAQKWAVTSTVDGKTESGYAWIDSRLGVVSKSQDESGEMEMKNVVEGTQPDAVFAIPASYRKMDLASLMQGLKNGQTIGSAAAGALGNAAKDVGKDAANETADDAKQKAKDDVKKKVHKIFHIP